MRVSGDYELGHNFSQFLRVVVPICCIFLQPVAGASTDGCQIIYLASTSSFQSSWDYVEELTAGRKVAQQVSSWVTSRDSGGRITRIRSLDKNRRDMATIDVIVSDQFNGKNLGVIVSSEVRSDLPSALLIELYRKFAEEEKLEYIRVELDGHRLSREAVNMLKISKYLYSAGFNYEKIIAHQLGDPGDRYYRYVLQYRRRNE
jgi:hypothetical protein